MKIWSRPRKIIWLVAALLIAFMAEPARADEAAEAKAVAVSTAWLAITDQGEYGAGWDAASTLIKSAVTRAQFVQALEGARAPLGALISRTLLAKQSATSLPGVPDGDYVVIQDQTAFRNKQSAVETITPKLADDGKWRVAGYYIR